MYRNSPRLRLRRYPVRQSPAAIPKTALKKIGDHVRPRSRPSKLSRSDLTERKVSGHLGQSRIILICVSPNLKLLRVAVLGCGFWSRFQMPAWLESPGVRNHGPTRSRKSSTPDDLCVDRLKLRPHSENHPVKRRLHPKANITATSFHGNLQSHRTQTNPKTINQNNEYHSFRCWRKNGWSYYR